MKFIKGRWIAVTVLAALLALCIWQAGNFQLKKERKQLKFGATYMTMNNPYFVMLNENIEEVVRANGDILITRDPLQDQMKQNAQIEDMIADGIDALFLQPVNWKGIQSSLNLCKENNIPVFVIDSNVYEPDSVVSTIISDNYDAGVKCAWDMMSKCTSAQIVIINQKNINSTNDRVKGFLDTIEGHMEYKVVCRRDDTAEFEIAMDEMKDIIYEGTQFDVVLGGNDPIALGCIAAMQLMGIEDKVKVYGIDGSPDAKSMIKAGYMEATSAQSPFKIGTTAAQTAYSYLDGQDVEKHIVIPVTLITSGNLKNYDISGWQ